MRCDENHFTVQYITFLYQCNHYQIQMYHFLIAIDQVNDQCRDTSEQFQHKENE